VALKSLSVKFPRRSYCQMADNKSPYPADCVNFLNASRDPFHAVNSVKNRLQVAGFIELKEKECWDKAIHPGGKYWFTRNQSSIVAFSVGMQWNSGNGFSIIGAHTDSPCMKVKQNSHVTSYGYNQVGVALYGGGLWFTWFDRDLSLSGRVIVSNENGGYESKLLYINRPILRVPSLAIHLDRSANEKFEFNKETNLVPILETVSSVLETKSGETHNTALMNLISTTLSVDVSRIHSFELSLCDFQDAVIGGINNEFIFSGRLDNLMSSYCATISLIESSTEKSLQSEENVRLIALFDHEECGSSSSFGAMSPLLHDGIDRICTALNSSGDILTTKANSFCISADMGHAIHPNYGSKHENNHRPAINKGPVLKTNVNQSYATNGQTGLVIEALGKKHNIPIQHFCIRNDGVCGSTIGPLVSRNLGIRTVDIGNPQLSMHSIREMSGVNDIDYCIKLFNAFYEDFPSLNKSIIMD